MGKDATEIVVGAGTFYLSTTVADSLPADTTAKGGSWGGDWVDLGYTGGMTVSITDERLNVEADQSTMELGSWVTKQEVTCTAELKQPTLAHLKYALGYGTLSTTGSTEVLQVGDNPLPSYYSVAVEGQSPQRDSAFRRLQIYKVTGAPSIEHAFQRDGETMLQVNFRALLHTSGSSGDNVFQVRDYIA